ncbi:SDR family NAD(P)-dependent oxidoreductase [Qaidamihabitans albus]|uniref:SDR family NAD(P)-dependent oxidoreductase n=1 Tax=Qaidamihabitans albus TaxID=2795733 RepID=UPI0018F1B417|nr:SDR family NAD(P)-dependent oxidoreductase [Qaidamihabitans albus]
MNRTRSMAGKVAVVTGGGRGIGAATAAALVRAGARVAVADLDLAAARNVADRAGPAATAFRLDVTDRPGFTACLDDVEQRLGPLEVLVNNAGIMPLARAEAEMDEATARVLVVNLHGVIHGSREAVRRMRPRGSGHVVNVASVAAKIAFPGGATYAAAKAGVLNFSDALRAELRGTGIDVSCVLPGIVATELANGIVVKGVTPITPEDAAAAIVGVLHRPRFEVYVPKSIGPALRLGALAGRRFGEWMQHALRADTPMLDAIGSAERAAYEERAASSRKGAS